MEEKLKDFIYTLASKMSKEHFTTLKELKLKQEILKVFSVARENEAILYDKRSHTFFNNAKEGILNGKDLLDAQKCISEYESGKKSYLNQTKQKIDIPDSVEEHLKEYCDDMISDIEVTKEILDSVKYLMDENEKGNDIFDIKNIDHFFCISMRKFDLEERSLLFSLFKKWASEIESEYQQLNKNQFQTSSPLITVKEIKESNYPTTYTIETLDTNIKEDAIYVRNLLKQGQSVVAEALVKNNRDSILVRILYDIEMELILLESELEDIEIVEELKEELLIEKDDIKRLIRGSKQWIR